MYLADGKSAPFSFFNEKFVFLPGLLVNLNCFSGIILRKNSQNQASISPVIQVLILKIMKPLRRQTFSKGFWYGKRQEKVNGLMMSACFGNFSISSKDMN